MLSPGSVRTPAPPNQNSRLREWGADKESQLRWALNKRSLIDTNCPGWVASGGSRSSLTSQALQPGARTPGASVKRQVDEVVPT